MAHRKILLDLLNEEGSLGGKDNGSGDLSGEGGGTARVSALESTRFSLINEGSRLLRRDRGYNQVKSRSKV